jgi:cation transporter-like permease
LINKFRKGVFMNFSIWAVSAGLVAELLAVAIALAAIALGHATFLEGELKVVLACVLFGGLGGITYCLRGVYRTLGYLNAKP